MNKTIGALKVKLHNTPKLGDHFVIETSNIASKGQLKEIFKVSGNTVKINLTLSTAMLLAEFIDDTMEELIMNEPKGSI